jgi:16S rRNA (guanine527-N7)-methyltransferase
MPEQIRIRYVLNDWRTQALDLGVSRETLLLFETYQRLLQEWQRVTDLVAPSTIRESGYRHFVDSLQLMPLSPGTKRWIDLGSGAGFPGMVIAIALRDVVCANVQLIESDKRKCAFLHAVARETGAVAKVNSGRIHDVLPHLDQAEVITARAVARLDALIVWSYSQIMGGATALFLKGQDVGSELTECAKYSNLSIELLPSITHAGGRIVRVRAKNP